MLGFGPISGGPLSGYSAEKPSIVAATPGHRQRFGMSPAVARALERQRAAEQSEVIEQSENTIGIVPVKPSPLAAVRAELAAAEFSLADAHDDVQLALYVAMLRRELEQQRNAEYAAMILAKQAEIEENDIIFVMTALLSEIVIPDLAGLRHEPQRGNYV